MLGPSGSMIPGMGGGGVWMGGVADNSGCNNFARRHDSEWNATPGGGGGSASSGFVGGGQWQMQSQIQSQFLGAGSASMPAQFGVVGGSGAAAAAAGGVVMQQQQQGRIGTVPQMGRGAMEVE